MGRPGLSQVTISLMMTIRVSDQVDTDAVVAAVLAWGGPRLRDLPWRRTRDPWAVLGWSWASRGIFLA